MGIKHLNQYLTSHCTEKSIQSICLEALSGKTVVIDTSIYLYKFIGENALMENMYLFISILVHYRIQPIFVFDGKPPAEKEAEVKDRRDARESATTQAANLKEYLTDTNLNPKERNVLEFSLARLEFQGWHMTRDIRHTFQRALWDMEIPYVKALGEADDVLADMSAAGKLDVVVSTDMDFLLSGVSRLWIPLRTRYDGFEEIRLDEVLSGEGLTLDGLRDAGILCGVEMFRGKVSISSHIAFSWVRYYKSIEGVLNSKIDDVQLSVLRDSELLEKVRSHFKTGPWDSRIRPDHLERCRAFMDAL